LIIGVIVLALLVSVVVLLLVLTNTLTG